MKNEKVEQAELDEPRRPVIAVMEDIPDVNQEDPDHTFEEMMVSEFSAGEALANEGWWKKADAALEYVNHFGGQDKDARRQAQIRFAGLVGKAGKTIYTYWRTAKAFPADKRAEHVSPTIHRDIALRLPVKMQGEALDEAAANCWTVTQVGEYIEAKTHITLQGELTWNPELGWMLNGERLDTILAQFAELKMIALDIRGEFGDDEEEE